MTVTELERDWLSLRIWVRRCVLPSSVFLLLVLGVFKLITAQQRVLDQNATIVGFFIFYFMLVRGGHMLMIRSMHKDMLARYEDPYKAKLARLPSGRLGLIEGLIKGRQNIGFALARIKRELINEFGVR